MSQPKVVELSSSDEFEEVSSDSDPDFAVNPTEAFALPLEPPTRTMKEQIETEESIKVYYDAYDATTRNSGQETYARDSIVV